MTEAISDDALQSSIVPPKVPRRWRMVQLRDISTLITKGTTPTTFQHPYVDDGIPFLRAEDVEGGEVQLSRASRKISFRTHELLRRSKLQAGDVLITIAGAIGRSGWVPDNIEAANINQAVSLVRLKNAALSEFISRQIESNFVQTQFRMMQRGVAQKNLNLQQIGDLYVTLPPMEEQHAIVSVLHKASRLRDLREEANELPNEIIQSVFLRMFGDPATNPMRWEEKTIADSIKVTSGDYFKFKEYSSTGIRLLKINNVSFGKIIWDDVSYLPEKYANSHKELVLKEGDILIALNRPIIGNRLKFGMLRKSDVPSILYQRVGRLDIRDTRRVNRGFLFGFLSTTQFVNALTSRLTGSDQPYINPTQLVRIKMYLPPIKLQEKFGSVLESITILEQRQQDSTQEINTLFHSIMQKAFRGELAAAKIAEQDSLDSV
jgi:type I restriction enzyme S subunit